MVPTQDRESFSNSAFTLAAGLSEAARRLDHAESVEEFVAAVQAHHQVWRRLREVGPRLGVTIPDRILAFSLAAPAKVRHGLDDDAVEALIRWDRAVSAAITEAFPG